MSHKFADSGFREVNGESICVRCGHSPNHEYHRPAEPSPEVAPAQNDLKMLHRAASQFPDYVDFNGKTVARLIERIWDLEEKTASAVLEDKRV